MLPNNAYMDRLKSLLFFLVFNIHCDSVLKLMKSFICKALRQALPSEPEGKTFWLKLEWAGHTPAQEIFTMGFWEFIKERISLQLE